MPSTSSNRIQNNLCPRCGQPHDSSLGYNCESCKEKERERMRLRHESNKDMCSRCLARKPAEGFKYCEKCRLNSKVSEVKARAKCKQAVYEAYGKACSCCGNPNLRVLQLDHKNNDGAEHRRKISVTLWFWAYQNNFPDTLQLLCANCHMLKTHYGRCSEADHFWYNKE
jgi:hypothetical protein